MAQNPTNEGEQGIPTVMSDSYSHSVGPDLLSYQANEVGLNHSREQKEERDSSQYRFDNTLVGSIAQLLRMCR